MYSSMHTRDDIRSHSSHSCRHFSHRKNLTCDLLNTWRIFHFHFVNTKLSFVAIFVSRHTHEIEASSSTDLHNRSHSSCQHFHFSAATVLFHIHSHSTSSSARRRSIFWPMYSRECASPDRSPNKSSSQSPLTRNVPTTVTVKDWSSFSRDNFTCAVCNSEMQSFCSRQRQTRCLSTIHVSKDRLFGSSVSLIDPTKKIQSRFTCLFGLSSLENFCLCHTLKSWFERKRHMESLSRSISLERNTCRSSSNDQQRFLLPLYRWIFSFIFSRYNLLLWALTQQRVYGHPATCLKYSTLHSPSMVCQFYYDFPELPSTKSHCEKTTTPQGLKWHRSYAMVKRTLGSRTLSDWHSRTLW